MAVMDIFSTSIAANSSWSLFDHGFAANQAVTYSIIVFPGEGQGVLNPAAHATLTQGETFQHVDGTVARKIYVQNNAPFNSVDVHVIAIVESL
jgi:hypothetical protein